MVLGTPMKTLVAKSQHAIIFMRPMRAILDVEKPPKSRCQQFLHPKWLLRPQAMSCSLNSPGPQAAKIAALKGNQAVWIDCPSRCGLRPMKG